MGESVFEVVKQSVTVREGRLAAAGPVIIL